MEDNSGTYVEYRNDDLIPSSSLPECPVATCISLIGSKWRLFIMRDLLVNGPMRFKELQRSIGGISQTALTGNLRAMEDSGIVARRVYAEMPPRVEYSLTEIGQSLRPVMESMGAWGKGYQEKAARQDAC